MANSSILFSTAEDKELCTETFEGNGRLTVGLFLEPFFSGFYDFIHDGDVNGPELFLEKELDDFIEFTQQFAQLGVKVVFDTIVGPA